MLYCSCNLPLCRIILVVNLFLLISPSDQESLPPESPNLPSRQEPRQPKGWYVLCTFFFVLFHCKIAGTGIVYYVQVLQPLHTGLKHVRILNKMGVSVDIWWHNERHMFSEVTSAYLLLQQPVELLAMLE